VQADADYPFVVEANGVEVAAVGTEFNVKFPEGEGCGVRAGEGTSGSGERNPAGDVDAESTGRL